MRRAGLTSLIAFVGITVALLVGVLAAGWAPLLGLDLQGGISVVLKPAPGTDPEGLDARLDQAMGIIRNRVDAIGVAEPDITRQGQTIVVQLPGVKDQERALELVGTTAELRFRPVLAAVPAASLETTTTVAGDGTATTVAGESTATTAVGDTTTAPSTTPATTAPSTTAPSTTAPSTTEAGMDSVGGPLAPGEYAGGASESAQAATTTAAPTTTAADGATVTTAATTDTTAPVDPTAITARADDQADKEVVLPSFETVDGKRTETFRYLLGPTLVSGNALSDASAQLTQNGQWLVAITFKDGDENIGAWRSAASACVAKTTTCPTGQLAVALDGEVLSAPTVQSDFAGVNSATITGTFTEREAKDLATALQYGSLPIELERQQSQEVSATVGNDALRAGVIAGIIGLVIVALYLLLYYKILGAVAIAALVMSFGLLWAVISWLGETQGLALTLAGVVGIIVSIGVSVDSNVVYFENIKDDMRSGRTLRSSAERSFRTSLSTILKADSVSLIGAGLLYWLTVGPVRGFAFYLGLSTLLDLVATWFFMRPAVRFLAQTNLASSRPDLFGIPRHDHEPPGGAQPPTPSSSTAVPV